MGHYQPWDRIAAKSKPNDQASFQTKNGPEPGPQSCSLETYWPGGQR